jgi:hypothetical protein
MTPLKTTVTFLHALVGMPGPPISLGIFKKQL